MRKWEKNEKIVKEKMSKTLKNVFIIGKSHSEAESKKKKKLKSKNSFHFSNDLILEWLNINILINDKNMWLWKTTDSQNEVKKKNFEEGRN